MKSNSDSCTKWSSIYTELSSHEPKSKEGRYSKTDMCFKEIKLMLLYPRLDINVTKHINHLLKSPFCVHPKTGLISVPLREEDIMNFEISKIPKIKEIVDGIIGDG